MTILKESIMIKMSLKELESKINNSIIRADLKEQFKFITRSIFKEINSSTSINRVNTVIALHQVRDVLQSNFSTDTVNKIMPQMEERVQR